MRGCGAYTFRNGGTLTRDFVRFPAPFGTVGDLLAGWCGGTLIGSSIIGRARLRRYFVTCLFLHIRFGTVPIDHVSCLLLVFPSLAKGVRLVVYYEQQYSVLTGEEL